MLNKYVSRQAAQPAKATSLFKIKSDIHAGYGGVEA
jgi:hypothetical protein